jgi:hypothetical protein
MMSLMLLLADKLHHFEKIRADATFALPYDYESATHPAWQFWRKLGKKGISTVATFKSLVTINFKDCEIVRSRVVSGTK